MKRLVCIVSLVLVTITLGSCKQEAKQLENMSKLDSGDCNPNMNGTMNKRNSRERKHKPIANDRTGTGANRKRVVPCGKEPDKSNGMLGN